MQSFSIPLKLVASPKFVKLCIQIVATFSNVRMKNFFRDAPPPPPTDELLKHYFAPKKVGFK